MKKLLLFIVLLCLFSVNVLSYDFNVVTGDCSSKNYMFLSNELYFTGFNNTKPLICKLDENNNIIRASLSSNEPYTYQDLGFIDDYFILYSESLGGGIYNTGVLVVNESFDVINESKFFTGNLHYWRRKLETDYYGNYYTNSYNLLYELLQIGNNINYSLKLNLTGYINKIEFYNNKWYISTNQYLYKFDNNFNQENNISIIQDNPTNIVQSFIITKQNILIYIDNEYLVYTDLNFNYLENKTIDNPYNDNETFFSAIIGNDVNEYFVNMIVLDVPTNRQTYFFSVLDGVSQQLYNDSVLSDSLHYFYDYQYINNRLFISDSKYVYIIDNLVYPDYNNNQPPYYTKNSQDFFINEGETILFNISAMDNENNNIYYAFNCDYRTSYLYGENFNFNGTLNITGWNNYCNYSTSYNDYLETYVLEMNSLNKDCISNFYYTLNSSISGKINIGFTHYLTEYYGIEDEFIFSIKQNSVPIAQIKISYDKNNNVYDYYYYNSSISDYTKVYSSTKFNSDYNLLNIGIDTDTQLYTIEINGYGGKELYYNDKFSFINYANSINILDFNPSLNSDVYNSMFIDNIFIIQDNSTTFSTDKLVNCSYDTKGQYFIITYIYDLYNRNPIKQYHTVIVKKIKEHINNEVLGLRESVFKPVSETFNENGVNTFILYLIILSALIYFMAKRQDSPFFMILTSCSLTLCFWYITFIPFWIMIIMFIIISLGITKFVSSSITGN